MRHSGPKARAVMERSISDRLSHVLSSVLIGLLPSPGPVSQVCAPPAHTQGVLQGAPPGAPERAPELGSSHVAPATPG